MITVNVRLFSILRHRAGGQIRDRLQLELPEGATVVDILTEIGAPDLPIVISVNEQQADPSTVLHDGDVVELIPAVAGGTTCFVGRICYPTLAEGVGKTAQGIRGVQGWRKSFRVGRRLRSWPIGWPSN